METGSVTRQEDSLAATTSVAGSLGPVFWCLWAGNLLSALAMFVGPFLALYLTSRGLPPGRVGLVISCYSVGSLLAGPAAGGLADALGRRRTLFVALVGSAAAAASLAFLDRPLAVAAAVFCFGAAGAASRAPMRAIIGDVVPTEALTRAFGWIYWADNVGASVSLVAGGFLAAGGWTLPFLADASTTAGFAIVVLFWVPETAPKAAARLDVPSRARVGYGVVLRDRSLLALLGLLLLTYVVYAQALMTLPVDMTLRGFSPRAFGFNGAVSAGLVVVLQPFSARVLQSLSPSRTLALGALLIALGVGGYAVCTTLSEFIAATTVWTLGEIAFFSTAAATVSALAPPDARGRYSGAYSFCFSIGGIVAPAAGLALLEAFGPRVLWPAAMGLGTCAAAGLLVWGRRRQPVMEPLQRAAAA
jgi:MFS family permease